MAVLFSGGVDCATIALLASHLLPDKEPLDLLNVAFENPRVLKTGNQKNPYDVPDRITARATLAELAALQPERNWRLIEVDIPYSEVLEKREEIISLMRPSDTVMDYVSENNPFNLRVST